MQQTGFEPSEETDNQTEAAFRPRPHLLLQQPMMLTHLPRYRPVDAGVEQQGRVGGQLGQVDHLGLLLLLLTLVHPHVRESGDTPTTRRSHDAHTMVT